MAEGLTWPASLRRVTALRKRPTVFGIFGIEYLIFIPLYAYVLQWCIDTSGEPYAAALAHYAASQNGTVVSRSLCIGSSLHLNNYRQQGLWIKCTYFISYDQILPV